MNIEHAADLLHKSRLFSALPKEILQVFVESCQMEEVAPDHTIIREGAQDPHLYFLLKGSCAVTKKPIKEGLPPLYLANIHAGESFGEASVFGDHVRTANVTAIDRVVYLKVHKNYFINFINTHPQQSIPFLMQVVAELLERLRNTTQELQLGQEQPADESTLNKFDKFFA